MVPARNHEEHSWNRGTFRMCGMDRQSCAVQAKPGCISGGNPFTGALPMQGCQQDAAIVHAFQSMQPLSADILQSRAASEGLRCMALLDFGSTFVAKLSRFSRLACQCSSSHGVSPPECQPRIEMDPGKSVGCNFLKSEPDAIQTGKIPWVYSSTGLPFGT